MFVPDVLHEFELGVWKAILAHLIRLLYAHGGDSAVNELDQRYISLHQDALLVLTNTVRFRVFSIFGKGTIRHFIDNISEMKKISGQYMEQVLKVCIFLPCLSTDSLFFSAQCLRSKASSLCPTTTRFKISSTSYRTFTHSFAPGFIRTQPSTTSNTRQHLSWELNSGDSLRPSAPTSRTRQSKRKQKLQAACVVPQQWPKRRGTVFRTAPVLGAARSTIFAHSRSTEWATMAQPSVAPVQWITLTHDM
jgi:hypothetical protein